MFRLGPGLLIDVKSILWIVHNKVVSIGLFWFYFVSFRFVEYISKSCFWNARLEIYLTVNFDEIRDK